MKSPLIFSLISQFMLFKFLHFCNVFGINNPFFDLFICMFNGFGLKQVFRKEETLNISLMFCYIITLTSNNFIADYD